MATFVGSQLAFDVPEQAARGRERQFGLLIVSALCLFALVVHGYHPYAEDGGLYLAGVERLLEPSLFPHATAFVLEPTRFSAFAPAVAGVARITHADLRWVLLGLHVASVWGTLWAAWMLAAQCWQSRYARAGAVTLLACWLGLPVAGTALLLMDPYLTARSVSTPCMVLALAGAMRMTAWNEPVQRRWQGAGLWLGSMLLAGMMHPLMAAYALAASLVLLCLRARRRSIRVFGTGGLCVAGLLLAATVKAAAPSETADYVRIVMTRSYWFLAEWRWYEVAGLIAPLAILTLFARRASSFARGLGGEGRSLALASVVVGWTGLLVALLFAQEGAATHLTAQLQPLRIFQTIYLVMTLMLGAKLGETFLRERVWRWALALLLLGGTMRAVARGAYPESSHLEMPWTTVTNPWVRAFLWVRENTPKDALFALDADYIHARGEGAQCFRAIAERSALPDYSKDGGEASIAPVLTPAWVAGQAAQLALSSETDGDRILALRPLGVSWVVLEAVAPTSFGCAYWNELVKVCRIPGSQLAVRPRD